MLVNISKLTASFLVIVSLCVVGIFDYLTGTEIRVFPLYFFPLMFAASRLGKNVSLVFSILASTIWLSSMYFAGREYSHPYIWALNFLTQGLAFCIVSVLYANLTQALEKEKVLSGTDSLTDLLNSRSFYERSEARLNLCNRNTLPITLAYIDLDNFKQANDTLGHLHGDNLLTKVAYILKKNLRSSDLVARMGGDEFVILFPGISAAGAQEALEKFVGLLKIALTYPDPMLRLALEGLHR